MPKKDPGSEQVPHSLSETSGHRRNAVGGCVQVNGLQKSDCCLPTSPPFEEDGYLTMKAKKLHASNHRTSPDFASSLEFVM